MHTIFLIRVALYTSLGDASTSGYGSVARHTKTERRLVRDPGCAPEFARPRIFGRYLDRRVKEVMEARE